MCVCQASGSWAGFSSGEPTGQRVGVVLQLLDATTVVRAIHQPEGIGEKLGARALDDAAQHALPGGIVEIILAGAGMAIPLHQVIERVVRKRGCRPPVVRVLTLPQAS